MYNKKAAMKDQDIDTAVVVKKRKTVQENIDNKVQNF